MRIYRTGNMKHRVQPRQYYIEGRNLQRLRLELTLPIRTVHVVDFARSVQYHTAYTVWTTHLIVHIPANPLP
jgi:hypothetical protein